MKSFLLLLLVETLTLKDARGDCDSAICWAQDPDPRGEEPIKLEKNRLVAEIPDLPPSWKITFDLKLTGHPKRCCIDCVNGILNMKDLEIKYSCANKRNVWVNFPYPHMKQQTAPGRPRRKDAVIRISHQINGQFIEEDKKRKLLIGHWTNFEISQLTEEYSYNKKRLMFKVVVDGKVLLHTEQREPNEGPVKVYASGGHWDRRDWPLPAEMKNVKIDINGMRIMNEEVLDKYTEAWQLGDMRPYLSILHPSYTLSGVSPTPVPRDEIYEFVIKFREQAAAAGGPAVESKDFLRLTNLIRTEFSGEGMVHFPSSLIPSREKLAEQEDAMIESANFEIPGFAKGIYHILVHKGKVMWEHAKVA